MLFNKICIGSMLLMTTLAYANGDCVQVERDFLADPELSGNTKFLAADTRARSTPNLKKQLQFSEKQAPTDIVHAMYACLARAELKRRESNDTTVADDPKARGRSARVM